uniref:Secreted protein n=1 Tax=Arundo donax TaxID=35708 RepID=A0A0A9GQR6_ARUDO
MSACAAAAAASLSGTLSALAFLGRMRSTFLRVALCRRWRSFSGSTVATSFTSPFLSSADWSTASMPWRRVRSLTAARILSMQPLQWQCMATLSAKALGLAASFFSPPWPLFFPISLVSRRSVS